MKTINTFSGKLFLALILAFAANVFSYAYDFKVGDLCYTILNYEEVAVVGENYAPAYAYLPSTLEIPSQVVHIGNTYTVTEIGDYAFQACKMLESVIIPNTVKKIGFYVFTGCTKLLNISFPESLEDVMAGALYECAWYDNQPDGLVYVGNLLYRYKGIAPTGVITINEGTKAVLGLAFSNQPNITSVILPESVTSVHMQAFGDCPNLESVTLPTWLSVIEDYTFQNCSKLQNINLPLGLDQIGKEAFAGCSSLTILDWPLQLKNIGARAFYNCNQLDGIENISPNIEKIGADAFGNTAWESKQPSGYLYIHNIFYAYTGEVTDSMHIEIRKGTTYISGGAVSRCVTQINEYSTKNVVSKITIPNSVTEIEDETFNRCRNLDTIICTSVQPPLISENTFNLTLQKNKHVLLLPTEALDIYKWVGLLPYQAAPYWNNFTNVKPITDPHVYDPMYFEKDSIQYHITNDTLAPYEVEVTHWYGLEQWEMEGHNYPELTTANIPASVTYKGTTYLVTRVGKMAFYHAPQLQHVTIGENVKIIDERAFAVCRNLSQVVIGENVDSILLNAFASGTSKIKVLDIPKNVKFIENKSLSAYSLEAINVHPDNANYTSVDGVLFNKQKNYLQEFPRSKATTYMIPDCVDTIGNLAFASNHNIVSISFSPNSQLKHIEKEAFMGCVFMQRLELPTSLQSIEERAFNGCSSLEAITSLNPTPPVMSAWYSFNEQVFGSVSQDIPLFVPAESVELYDAAPQWDRFATILPIGTITMNDFPTLAGLQRTHTIEMYDHAPNDGKRSGGYPLPFASVKDTVINGKTYLQFGDYVNGSDYSLFFLREENNKVLIYSSILQNDLVLYDYTLELGDSLPAITSDHDYFSDDHFTKLDKAENIFTYVVTDVSTVTLLDGIERKKWILKNKYLPIIEYVEGIGCYGENTSHSGDFFRLIHDHPYRTEYVGDHLVCVSKNGQLLYSMPQEEMNSFTLTCECLSQEDTIAPKDLFPTLWGLQRTSCTKTIGEDEYGTVWGSRSYLMQEIETATIDGKQYLLFGINDIYSYDEYCSLWLREENNKILVYSTAQKKDLVLYDFTLNVGDSLPRLYVDYDLSSVVDYDNDEWGLSPLVVTEVSTITLLDGEEYKKWTFDNGMQYVEGIGSFGTSYAHNDFYQLIANAPLSSDVYSQSLVCASRNGQLLYKMDEIEMAQLETECLCEIEPKWSETWCNQWNILSHGYLGPQDPLAGARTSIYWLSNNTVNRNGQEYIPLMCSSSLPNEESTHLVGELRFTEDKQVYFYYAFDETEYLLYDFGAELGDTLELFAGLEFYNYHKTYTHVITDKETLDDGRLQIQADVVIRIDNGAGEYFEEKHPVTWIEGLGSTYGIIFNPSNPGVAGDGAIIMLCAYRDDECVYTTNFSDYKNMGCVYNNDGTVDEDLFPMLAGLQRTVCNEFCGDTEDDNSSNTTYKQTFDKILFERDQPYIYCNSAFLLREENNKILIYSHSLDKDLVLYDFTLEVGDSLPQLYLDEEAKKDIYWIYYEYMNVVDYNKYNDSIYPADTLIVTDVSMITLLDGKEYKKWTFNNGMEYVEGIGMYGSRRGGNFFGLIQEVVVPCHTGTHLVCASKNGQLLYKMDDAEMERLGAECLCEVETSYKSQWCNTWNVFRHSGGARLDSEETWQYKLDRDTIINGKLYSTVIYYLTSDPSREYYIGAVRFGDDRKVYRAIGNSESVVYDFTAQVGDTLGPGVVYDVEVDSLTNLKTIYFHPYDRYEDEYIEYATVKWIEGVGSTDGFLLAKDYGTVGGPSFYLLCAYRDDELKYAANKNLGCRYNAGEVTHEHFPTLAGLSRTIHEERSTNDTTRKEDFTKVVLDIKKPTLYHSQIYLYERDNKIFVISRTYKNLGELYEYVLYDFTLEVGDSLPMLYIDYSSRGNWGPTYPLSILNVVNYRKEADGTIYPGDTLVVTEVSTITLLDGKEYKKWTFNNGMEYAEGIGSLSGDFYELIANKRTTEDLTASQLVCASQNGQLLYKMDDAEMERLGTECLCDYTSGPKKDNAKDGQIGGRPTPTQWNMLEMELRKMENGITILQAETFSYILEDISQQVNNKTYFQLTRQSTKDTATTKSVVGALHFGKDEDNRVYFLRDGMEYVLYDFTAEPGDTVEIFAGVNNYPQETTYTHVVTGKDTLENGACRMILEVVFPDETTTAENAEKVWLAGLGSIDGIVHNAASRASNARSSETQTSVMLCAWRDDDCLYTTDHPDYDTLGCVYNTESTGVGNTTSSTSYQKILRNGQLLILHQGRIYNVIGVEIK